MDDSGHLPWSGSGRVVFSAADPGYSEGVCFGARQTADAAIKEVVGTLKEGMLHGLAKLKLENGQIVIGR